jgi:hypothetical protein
VEKRKNATRRAKQAATVSQGKIGGHDLGDGRGADHALAVVVKVTVAVVA